MLDMLGNVAEFGNANVFMARDGVVYTPAPNGTFLNGITRQRVIDLLRADGVTVVETTLTYADFLRADEIFSSGNFAKVAPVIRIDDRSSAARAVLQPGAQAILGLCPRLNSGRLWLQAERLPHAGRPLGEVDAVGMEHRHRQAVHSERHAAGMGRLTVHVLDVPGRAEMVAVIIEAHAGRRLFFGTQRDQQLEFQRSCCFWLTAFIWPTRPKNGSLA
jgi:hypothetical protein